MWERGIFSFSSLSRHWERAIASQLVHNRAGEGCTRNFQKQPLNQSDAKAVMKYAIYWRSLFDFRIHFFRFMQTPENTPTGAPVQNSAPTQAFAPLPLRALGVLEIVDTAIKLLRRYFLVLMAWSTIVMLGSNGFTLLTVAMTNSDADPIGAASAILGASFMGMMIAFFLWPLITGAVTCCIAAAVRGQNVTFGQCWNFTKPRYGKILGTYFLAILMTFVVFFAYLVAIGLLVALGAIAVRGAGDVSSIIFVVGIILLYVSMLILGLAVVSWMMLAPVVACLENDPVVSPLRRAFDLLKGNWRRAMNLALLFGLIQLVVILIVSTLSFSTAGALSPGGGVEGFLTTWGQATSSALYMILTTLTSILTTPLMLLLVAVLYLDLRTRKEALDLEWTAHVTSDGVRTPATNDHVPAPVFTPPSPMTFSGPTVPAPPPNAPPISPEMQAAWLGTATPASTSPDAAPQNISATQVLPNNSIANDFSPTVSSDVSTHNVGATPLQDAPTPTDAPINAWSSEPATSDVTALNQQTPPAAPSAFTQILPPDDASSTRNEVSNALNASARTCPQCGAAVQSSQSFCMQCGARLPFSGAA
jgi:hypothetical protein